ncbi:hypothetical protein ACHAP5_011370 [Fusarium lateritium]
MSEAYDLQHWGRKTKSSLDFSLLFRALSIQQRLQRGLSSWLQAYRVWTKRPPSSDHPPLRPAEQLAQRLLLVYYTMASIITDTALYAGDESVFDHHVLQFASIIAWAKELTETNKPSASKHAASHSHCSRYFTFTSDLGLIPALYYTAIKCRDLELRKTALSMLATKTHQEGIWEGSTAALIAAEVIRLETPNRQDDQVYGEVAISEPCKSVSSDLPLPPSWRISDIRIELPDGPDTDLVLICRRELGNSAWDVVERRNRRGEWY